MHKFKLFIMGESPKSLNLIEEINVYLEELLGNQFQLAVIDILQNPETSGEDGVFATPTLVKKEPLPVARIVGDLHDMKKVAHAMGM